MGQVTYLYICFSWKTNGSDHLENWINWDLQFCASRCEGAKSLLSCDLAKLLFLTCGGDRNAALLCQIWLTRRSSSNVLQGTLNKHQSCFHNCTSCYYFFFPFYVFLRSIVGSSSSFVFWTVWGFQTLPSQLVFIGCDLLGGGEQREVWIAPTMKHTWWLWSTLPLTCKGLHWSNTPWWNREQIGPLNDYLINYEKYNKLLNNYNFNLWKEVHQLMCRSSSKVMQ